MALLGQAAVAMWWNVAPEQRKEFYEWHSKEHFPERMGIAGFRRGSRWRSDDGAGHFVIYELADYETLTSDGYRARLNDPTPWSRKMMPHHLGMVRSQCRLEASFGFGIATFMATLRLSPQDGGDRTLHSYVHKTIADLPRRPGLTGAHFLITDTPKAVQTAEQRIRGGDAAADWIVLVSGHSDAALRDLLAGDLSERRLASEGAGAVLTTPPYRLMHAVTPQDFAD